MRFWSEVAKASIPVAIITFAAYLGWLNWSTVWIVVVVLCWLSLVFLVILVAFAIQELKELKELKETDRNFKTDYSGLLAEIGAAVIESRDVLRNIEHEQNEWFKKFVQEVRGIRSDLSKADGYTHEVSSIDDRLIEIAGSVNDIVNFIDVRYGLNPHPLEADVNDAN